MKIAIYGDSFGCINTKWDHSMANLGPGPSWIEMLEETNEITNYSISGTAFMFSYERFLKHHKEHDLNIFIVTNPQRIYIKALDGVKMFGSEWAELEHNRIKKMPWYGRRDVHLEILKSVKTYLELWADFEMIEHTQHILVSNMWNIAPNTLIVPGFSNSIEQASCGLHDLAMHELKLADEEGFYKFDFNYMQCKRQCHFSKENNQVVYEIIKQSIENKEKFVGFDVSRMLVPPNKDIFYYIK
jgi:hypothetical protein